MNNKSDNEELYRNNCDNSKVKFNENNVDNIENCMDDKKNILKNGNNSQFESFWALHGDSICLNSWVEKYKDYISPEFLESFKQCDDFSKIANLVTKYSDTWSSMLQYQNAVEHDSSCTDKKLNSETSEVTCADDIALHSPHDSCDSALKNINDKFENMSFTNEIGIDNNVKYIENAESVELELSLDSYELYSENILPYTTADFEKSELQLDFIENGVKCIDIPIDSNLFVTDTPKSVNDVDINLNDPAHRPFEGSFQDRDFMTLKQHYPESSERCTQNPLFICTKSDEEYEAEVKFQTWEQLWFVHCQQEFDKYLKIFSETTTEFCNYHESSFSECKYCGELNCVVCESEHKNSDITLKVSDLFYEFISDSYTKNNLSYPDKVLAFPVTQIAKDMPDIDEASKVENKLNSEACSDDEPPMELPIKRL